MYSIRTLYFRHSVITLAPHWSQSCWYHVGIFHLPFLHPYHRSSISFDASSPRTTRSSSSAPAKSMARSATKLRKVGKADLRQTNRCHWSSRLALGLADFVPLPLLPVESTWQCLGVSNLDRPLLAALPVCRPCESHAHRVNPINTINSRISYKYCDQWRKISRCSSCAKLHVDIWGSKPRKTSFVYIVALGDNSGWRDDNAKKSPKVLDRTRSRHSLVRKHCARCSFHHRAQSSRRSFPHGPRRGSPIQTWQRRKKSTKGSQERTQWDHFREIMVKSP